MPDGLFGLATALVAIPSVSHHEAPMADAVEAALRLCPWLTVVRVGDNVVARTEYGRGVRLLLGGHLALIPVLAAAPAPGPFPPRRVSRTPCPDRSPARHVIVSLGGTPCSAHGAQGQKTTW